MDDFYRVPNCGPLNIKSDETFAYINTIAICVRKFKANLTYLPDLEIYDRPRDHLFVSQ